MSAIRLQWIEVGCLLVANEVVVLLCKKSVTQ